MGTLFSSLYIGTSGIQAAQVALDTTGHNIANANTDGYSRQRVLQEARFPVKRSFGQIGRGVSIQNIERVRDEFLDITFRDRRPGLGFAETTAQFYAQIEDVFLEPTDNGFGERLNLFFDTLNTFSGNVESIPVREALVSEAQALAVSFNDVAGRLDQLRTSANEELRNAVPEINSITGRIAELNRLIRNNEANGTQSNDLRDARDLLLDELATFTDYTYRDTPGGVLVLVQGRTLVDPAVGAREIEAVRNSALDPEREDFVELRFADNGELFASTDGSIFAAQEMRDVTLPALDARMDELAGAIIEEINRIQANGNGIRAIDGTITGGARAADPAVALNAAGLPFTVTPGSFDVVVYDAADVATTTTVNVNAGTTLNDLAASINAVAGVSAAVVDNRLEVTPAAPNTLAFANDTSGALAALQVDSFFTGFDARTMGVNQELADDPGRIASAYSLDAAATGDNRAALDMAAVRDRPVLDSGLVTVNEHYETTVVRLGVQGNANLDNLAVEQAFVEDFDRRRQEVSGVSLDEEVTNLIVYQRAFEAAARAVTVTDRMLEALLAMAR